MKAAIAIDDWKLPIFERHLGQSGYVFTHAGNLIPGVLILTVETINDEALAAVVKAANAEATRSFGDGGT